MYRHDSIQNACTISGNKTTAWSSGYAGDSDEVVILIRVRGHLLKVLPS